MSSEPGEKYAYQILADAEICIMAAGFKIKAPGYLKSLIFEGLKGYGQGITAIPADSSMLKVNQDET